MSLIISTHCACVMVLLLCMKVRQSNRLRLIPDQMLRCTYCCCRERIERAIEVGREAEKFGAPPSQAISLMERADTIQALPVSTARGSIDLTRAHTHSPIRDVTHEVRFICLGAAIVTTCKMQHA